MNVQSSLICQTSLQDEATKNVSLINVIDQLNVTVASNSRSEDGLFHIPFSFELVTHFYGDDIKGKTYQFSIETRDQKNTLLHSSSHEMGIPQDKKRFRLCMKVVGITLSDSGVYDIRLVIREKGESSEPIIVSTPLDVTIDIK